MRKFLIKIKCFFNFHSWKKITSTNRSGKPICTTVICKKCKKTIIK